MIKNEFKKIIKNIFSLRNDGTDKLITIFGIPIRIDCSRYYKDLMKNTSVIKNKIIFNNFHGSLYGCNPKYIAEEIIKRKLPYNLYWMCKQIKKVDKSIFPKEILLVPFNGCKSIKELASSRIIISNVRTNLLINRGWTKKEGQTYIQTWHGSLGIKKIDAAVGNYSFATKQWCDVSREYDSKYMDYLLSNSTFEDKVFENGLWYEGPILKTGHPRNDVFFKTEDDKLKIKEKVFSTLEIDRNKKILLYVPSYRDDKRLDCYGLDTNSLIKALEEKFGGDWVVAIRLHPHVKKYSTSLYDFGEKVVDASFYPDIQELLVSSEAAITDYSSCIFDFMLSRKPGFIFATDLDEYNTERGFYYPLEETPFPVAKNNQDLCQNILNFENKKYVEEVEKFLKDKGCMEDGHASERVVDLIEKIIAE